MKSMINLGNSFSSSFQQAVFYVILVAVILLAVTHNVNANPPSIWTRATTVESSNGNAGKITRNAVLRSVPSSVAYDQFLQRAQKGVESLRKKIEEWGTVTISAPVVISEKAQFALSSTNDLTTPAFTYIDKEATGLTGGSFVSNESALQNQLSAALQPTFKANPVTGQQEPVLEPSAATTGSSPPLPNITNVNTVLAGGTTAFAAPGSLLSGLTTTGIPERTAVILGMNDKLTERIFQNMANPDWKDFVNKDYEIFFAIVQVSCNPGWRTRDNYIADVSATLDYSDEGGNIMQDARHRHPLVFSVLPLLDAQNLELGSSDRNLLSLASQVNAAYPTVGLSILGQDLLTFVHRYQKDNITRSPITVTNSYSSGRSFGFRLAPSFVAQKDPGYRKSGAADVLSATSFPVLIIAVVNLHDIWDQSDLAIPDARPAYDYIAFQVSNRWLINDRPPLTQLYRRWFMPLERETFSMRCDWAEDVADIKNILDEASTYYRRYLGERRRDRDKYENDFSKVEDEVGSDQSSDHKTTSDYSKDSKPAANTPSTQPNFAREQFVSTTNFKYYTEDNWDKSKNPGIARTSTSSAFVSTTEDNDYGVEFDPVLSLLRKEVEHYEAVTNAFPQTFAMFSASDSNLYTPEVTRMFPDSVPVRGSFSVVLRGKNLRSVQSVMIGGKISDSIAHLIFAADKVDSLLCQFNSGEIRISSHDEKPEINLAGVHGHFVDSSADGEDGPSLSWTGSTTLVYKSTINYPAKSSSNAKINADSAALERARSEVAEKSLAAAHAADALRADPSNTALLNAATSTSQKAQIADNALAEAETAIAADTYIVNSAAGGTPGASGSDSMIAQSDSKDASTAAEYRADAEFAERELYDAKIEYNLACKERTAANNNEKAHPATTKYADSALTAQQNAGAAGQNVAAKRTSALQKDDLAYEAETKISSVTRTYARLPLPSSTSGPAFTSGTGPIYGPGFTGTATTTVNAKYPSMNGGTGEKLGTTDLVLFTNVGAYPCEDTKIIVIDYDGDLGSKPTVSGTDSSTKDKTKSPPATGGLALTSSTAGSIISINTNVGTAASTPATDGSNAGKPGNKQSAGDPPAAGASPRPRNDPAPSTP